MTKFQISTYFESILERLPDDGSFNDFDCSIGDAEGNLLVNIEKTENPNIRHKFLMNVMEAEGNPFKELADALHKRAVELIQKHNGKNTG